MIEDVFQDCLKHWKESKGNSTTPFWGMLAVRHGYPTADAIRSAFKRERKARGISKKDVLIGSSNLRIPATMQQNPKVVVFDVETLPMKIEGSFFNLRDVYLKPSHVKEHGCLLSWAGVVLGETQMYSDIMTPKEAVERDTLRIISSLREFLSDADFVIAHNISFDSGIVNNELTKHGIPPLAYRPIDTYSLIRQTYTLPSYSLSYVNSYFGIRDKMGNDGMPLWEECVKGENQSLITMLEYNQGDVLSTEALFWKIQPYAKKLPNFSTYSIAEDNCFSCNCGSTDFKEDGTWRTNLAVYKKYVCSYCGAIHRGRRNLLSKDYSSKLLSIV